MGKILITSMAASLQEASYGSLEVWSAVRLVQGLLRFHGGRAAIGRPAAHSGDRRIEWGGAAHAPQAAPWNTGT